MPARDRANIVINFNLGRSLKKSRRVAENEYWLTINFDLSVEKPWASIGHHVYSNQAQVPTAAVARHFFNSRQADLPRAELEWQASEDSNESSSGLGFLCCAPSPSPAVVRAVKHKLLPALMSPLKNPKAMTPTKRALSVVDLGDQLVVQNSGANPFRITFEKSRATFINYEFKGQQYIHDGMTPNLWRAPTDNDEGGVTRMILRHFFFIISVSVPSTDRLLLFSQFRESLEVEPS